MPLEAREFVINSYAPLAVRPSCRLFFRPTRSTPCRCVQRSDRSGQMRSAYVIKAKFAGDVVYFSNSKRRIDYEITAEVHRTTAYVA